MRYLIMIAVALSTFGCAFANYSIDLPEGIGTGLKGGNGRKISVNIPFSDERPDKTRCGMQKNGYNMDTASGLCSDDPAAWIAKILSRELRAAGFEVVNELKEEGRNVVRVEGQVLQVFVEPVMGAWDVAAEADIDIKLILQSDSGLRAERRFYVKGVRTRMIAMPDLMQTSMQEAFRQTLVQMVEAIISLMNRYPQLGMRRPILPGG